MTPQEIVKSLERFKDKMSPEQKKNLAAMIKAMEQKGSA